MPTSVRLTFLGTSTSHGIPVIGCPCAVCHSTDRHNQRYRPSVVIHWNGRIVLIDTPPELRLQLLRADISQIDAVLFTHSHADHIYGLDDLRVFSHSHRSGLPVYGMVETLAVVERLKPRQTYFTHICHDLDHDPTNRRLPAGVALAFDGLVVDTKINRA